MKHARCDEEGCKNVASVEMKLIGPPRWRVVRVCYSCYNKAIAGGKVEKAQVAR